MRSRIRWMLVLAALVAMTAFVVGCGSDDNKDSGAADTGAAAAETTAAETTADAGGDKYADLQKAVDAQMTRPTDITITEPLSGPAKKSGTVDYLTCGAPTCVELGKSLKEAAESVGWKYKELVGGPTPELVKAAWGQVVRDKPDAVVISGGFPPSIFKDELATVQKRGVPIVSYGDPEATLPEGFSGIVDGGVRMKEYLGPTFADWVTVKTQGKANVLYVYTSTYPVLVQQVDGYKAQIAKDCPECKNTYFDAPATSIGKDLASKVASQMQAHPDVNYVIGAFNDLLLGVPEALKGVGVDLSKVKLITQDDNVGTFQAIQKGDIEMTLHNPAGETMWQSFDIVLRTLNKQESAKSQDLASYTKWLITKDNLPPESDWESLNSVADYKAQFQKLWGVG